MDAPWRIELFGWLRATDGSQVVRRFRMQKVGALLAYLAYYGHRSHPRDVLIELLWPDCEPEAGRNRLSVALSSLRRQLEPPGVPPGAVIVADHATVQLNPAAVTTDVAQFEAALQAAKQAGRGIECVQRLSEAAELYHGELLPGFFEEWVLPERERQSEAFFQALSQLIALLEQAGDLPGAVQWAQRAVAADSLREEAHGELIRLLAATGQPEAALRQYRELERLLDEQLGSAPAPGLRDLVTALRSQPGDGSRQAGGGKEGGHPQGVPLRTAPVGAPLVGALPGAATLPTGTVTFLLTDIEGSTALWERVGESFPEALASHHGLLRSLFAQHHGFEVKEMGDAFLVAFSRAGDALACAVAAQRALAAHPWPAAEGHPQGVPLHVRMALHTGDVVPEGGDYHGLVLHHAQRVLVAGHGGQILCSEATATLLRRDLAAEVRLADLGVYRLRDVTVPERLFQVEYPGRERETFPPLKAEPGYASNLPLQFTRFFGREEEVALLSKLLGSRETRLVTLMGSGGSGKTRLALEVARQAGEAWHGATWFVPLADVTEARRIGEAVRDAMRLPRSAEAEPLEQAIAALSQQATLLLLDNFEHLVAGGGPLVQGLLEQVPELTCLVTSRQRLDVPGEREFLVTPLPTPERAAPPEVLVRYESVRLFVDRAQAVRADFQVTPANAAAVAALCEQLEGIPLALELAAARVGVLTPAQMLPRLSHRFELLTRRRRDADTHHHSLRATLDWSYQLLSPELQRFFARLSVFRGGWTLAAAEAVCEEPSALDYLDELRECSLVQAEERAGEMRYRLLETLREYGAEQLTPAERDDLAERHGTYYLALAEQAVPELRGPAQGEWLERLEVEHDNLRATLDGSGNCVAVEAGLQLGWALQPFWAARGYLDEGRERLARLLALPGAAASTAARAKALQSSGILAGLQGDYPAARSRFEEALAIQRELGNRQDVASLLNNLGMVAWHQGDDASSRPLFEESLAIRRESGSKQEISGSLNNLGLIAWNQGDYETARSFFEQGLVLLRELDHTGGIALVLNNLGNVALNQKDYPAARAYCEESLAVAREIGDKRVIAIALYNLGGVALHGGDHAASCSLRQESLVIRHELGDRVGVAECLEGLADAAGQTERAARLLGAAQALRDALGAPVAPAVESGHQDDVAAVRTALGKEAFAAAWAEGQSMALEQAVQYALQERKDEASGDAGT